MEDNVPAGVGIANVVEDTTPQLGGTLDSNAHQISWSKGADVASANALVLGTDGNYFDITGTTAILSIGTLAIGTVVMLHFDGILTLTHQATDLILPGGANITTAAGDEAMFVEYATGDWRCISYTKASGKAVIASDYKPGGTDVAIADGGTGQGTAQAAIDALSQVAGATNEHVFTKDTGTGNAKWKVAAGGLAFTELLGNEQHHLSAADTWEDWDLSAIVPSGTKSVLVSARNGAATPYDIGARKNGSALDRGFGNNYTYSDILYLAILLTEVDANRIIEVKSGHATSVDWGIKGYWS